jgi:hypothetical protein
MTSFFEHKNYTTHISQFHNPPTPLTLDSISVSIKGSERVKDCKVWHKGVDSDHSTIKLTFSLTSINIKHHKNSLLVKSIGTRFVMTKNATVNITPSFENYAQRQSNTPNLVDI